MFIQPRPEIQSLKYIQHGALDYIELESLEFSSKRVIDFSTNCNPFGPSAAVKEVLQQSVWDQYPDRDCLALRRAISGHHNIPTENVLATNGTAELIWLIALSYLNPTDPILILGPTFSEYANAAAIMGAKVHEVQALPERDFKQDYYEIDKLLNHRQYRLVYICNPNNPSGQIIELDILLKWAEQHPKTLFIIDEAYAAFARGFQSVIPHLRPNILVMRSMTKDYALAGFRLGYALAHSEVIGALKKTQPPWSVNSLAQTAGVAALREQDYLNECLDQLEREKRSLLKGLSQLGYKPIPSQTHFFLLNVDNGAQFRSALLERNIQVRDCASFGLPAYVRIAIRRSEENQKLLCTIKKSVSTKSTMGTN